MSCRHRFYNSLIPVENDFEFLVLGTFNPEWNAVSGNNADYFYGRDSNLFWCIVPHAFDELCLINSEPNEWKNFCLRSEHKIAITDLVKEIKGAEKSNPEHFKLLTSGFEDKNLEKFELTFNESEIKDFIDRNHKTLAGVFLTRKSKGQLSTIWDTWLSIKNYCNQKEIRAVELLTPSSRGRNSGIRKKIEAYKNEIEQCRKHLQRKQAQ